MTIQRLLLAVLLAALASACGSASHATPDTSGAVASVTVTLSSASLAVGDTGNATATLKDSAGTVLPGRVVTWASSATSVATVSATGVLSAVGTGASLITATSEGVSGAATLYVHVPGKNPAHMASLSSLFQTAAPGSAVFQAPVVRITDASKVPVGGVTVTFAVTAGGGSVSGGTTVTDSDGQAQPAAWIFGPAGPQSLQATTDALPGVAIDFAGNSRPASQGYDITLRLLTPMTPNQVRAFVDAKERIQEVVTGDVAPQLVNLAADPTCGNVAINETVDDILILAEIGPKDGAGNVLGLAGPCWVWDRPNGFLIVGHMLFDIADVPKMEANGTLDNVILHEMFHVLGFGTLWDSTVLVGAGTSDPYFKGANARNDLATLNGGAAYGGTPVPVENLGTVGDGTRDSHWRESVFVSELMTGYASTGANPLSATTVGSMQDLGYGVDVSRADPFSLFNPSAAVLGTGLMEQAVVPLAGDVRPQPPIFLDADGRPIAR